MIRPDTFSAKEQASFTARMNECVSKLECYISQKQLVGVMFFIDSESDSDYFDKKSAIVHKLDQRNWMFPFNVQAQSPQSSMSMEVWLEDTAQSIEYSSQDGVRYTRVKSNQGKSIWGIGITYPSMNAKLESQVDFSFETMKRILAKENMTLSDIVRQWNYIPNILGLRVVEGKTFQNYQVFNEIRQKHYSMTTFHEGYPSATGIGTKSGNFNLDFYAVESSKDIQKIGLSNPKQQDAYKYDQTCLIGDSASGQNKKAPLFERAKLLRTDKEAMVFISGTASIIGQETVGLGDVHFQTEITINNMQELLPRIQKQFVQYTYVRAYIKEIEDFETVKSICDSSFPNVNVSYLQADVCRDNLLVEIEAAAVFGQ